MPFYEYRCTEGHTFEVRQSMSDEPLDTCEVCGAKAQRVLFAPAIHFKGTGFHNTDYASKRRGGAGDGGDSSPASGGADGASNGASGGGDAAKAPAKESSGSTKTVGLDKV